MRVYAPAPFRYPPGSTGTDYSYGWQNVADDTLARTLVTAGLMQTGEGGPDPWQGGQPVPAAMAAERKVFIPLTSNHNGILNALVAALAVGGSVELPSGLYDLTDGGTNTSPLPVYSGVSVKCPIKPVFQWASSGFIAPDSTPTAVLAGAVLQGDGTFDAFAGNTTALGSPPSSISNAGFSGLHYQNLVFKNVKSGLRIGGTNNSGAWHSEFRNLYGINTTDFAVNLENWQHIDVANIFSFGCVHGQRYSCSFPANNLSPGNSTFSHLFCVRPGAGVGTISTRGIVFEAYGTNAELNELDVGYIQCNGGAITVSPVTATMSSASANIAVPDASLFNTGDQVFFGVQNTNGFNTKELGQSYFIVGRDTTANWVQVSDTFGGAAKMPTNGASNSTQTLGSYGRPGIELLGWNGGTIKHFTLAHIDLETVSTGGLLLQNAISGRIGLRNVPALGANAGCSHVVARSSSFKVDSTYEGIVVDADTPSSYDRSGCRVGKPIQHNPGFGVSRDEQFNARVGLAITEYDKSDIYANAIFSADCLFTRTPQQWTVQQRGSGETETAVTNFITYNGAGGGSRTLPQITSDAQLGWVLSWTNPSTGTLTINTSGSQTFNNKAGSTALTIPANGSAMVQAQKIGASYIWAVVAAVGAVTF